MKQAIFDLRSVVQAAVQMERLEREKVLGWLENWNAGAPQMMFPIQEKLQLISEEAIKVYLKW